MHTEKSGQETSFPETQQHLYKLVFNWYCNTGRILKRYVLIASVLGRNYVLQKWPSQGNWIVMINKLELGMEITISTA